MILKTKKLSLMIKIRNFFRVLPYLLRPVTCYGVKYGPYTAAWWYMHFLPADVAMKAVKNCDNLSRSYDSLPDALLLGFFWIHSHEIEDYWLEIYNVSCEYWGVENEFDA